MRTASEIMAKINALQAELDHIVYGITNSNTQMLIEEVTNLLDGVGDGYVEGDYYAPSRYYSNIPGVKNIRIFNPDTLYDYHRVIIKIVSPIGKNFPDSVVVRGIKYKIVLDKSTRYSNEVDY